MHSLSKHYKFLLLSGALIFNAYVAHANPSLASPLQPVFTKNDDVSRALVKPSVIYEEAANTKIEIQNMPAYKTQDELGECRAFSLGTILQKNACDRFKLDCRNIPANWSLSYFGLLAYTNLDLKEERTFQPNQSNSRSFYELIKSFEGASPEFILESCKPFHQMVNNFSNSGKTGIEKSEKFFAYLKDMYNRKRGATEADIADCPECVQQINSNLGVNTDLLSLKKALTEKNYDKFLYALFFDGCEMKNFPSAYTLAAYPVDSKDATPAEVKGKILEGLKENKPVLFPNLCLSFKNNSEECDLSHSVVIAGYKKACLPNKPTQCKDIFKVHNSWGADWQKINNDGWVDADVMTQNIAKIQVNGKYRIPSSAVMWLVY